MKKTQKIFTAVGLLFLPLVASACEQSAPTTQITTQNPTTAQTQRKESSTVTVQIAKTTDNEASQTTSLTVKETSNQDSISYESTYSDTNLYINTTMVN